MVLPSISDAGSTSVVISPFTTLFSDAIVQGKQNSELKDELHKLKDAEPWRFCCSGSNFKC